MHYSEKFKKIFADADEEAAENNPALVLKRCYIQILDLPQFIEIDGKALNVMNGCLVELYADHLLLIWHRGGASVKPHEFKLEASNTDKFLIAMLMQAKLL